MILVTGATGHVGNVLVRELLNRGEMVRALVLPGEERLALDGLDVEVVEGDILQLDSIAPAFQGIRLVYHLAGFIYILPGNNEWVHKVNVDGTKNVLQAARQMGVERLVYTSSIHALAQTPLGVAVDEKTPFDPLSPTNEYDRSKAEASLAVLEAANAGLSAVIVCPTGIIGPHDYRGSEMGRLIMDWMGERVSLLIDGDFDWVDVRDVAHGLILASEKGRSGEAYILGGERVSLIQLWEMVRELVSFRGLYIKIPRSLARLAAHMSPWYYRLVKARPRFTRYSLETILGNTSFSYAKAHQELGYCPRSMQETLADTVHWWQLPH